LNSKYGRELEKAFTKACKLNENFTEKKEEKNSASKNLFYQK
jgi:hypothetical protein